MRESKVEAHLTKRVKALGGEVRKVKWIGRAGAPDRLVLLPYEVTHDLARGYRTMLYFDSDNIEAAQHPLVELKRPGKDAEPHQAREHERLRAAGFVVLVLDTIEKIDEVFG
jgi:hypothetical protein